MIVAPAMNTQMWNHPFTAQHLAVLSEFHVLILPPVSKTLACGDVGTGALAHVDDMIRVVKDQLQNEAS